MLRVLSDILTSMDNQQVTLVAILDLSAAFDCVDHDILSKMQSSFGLGGITLTWILSCLTDRSQRVLFSGSLSIESINSTHSLMRKDLTGHTGPNGHLHMPTNKTRKKDKQNKHAKFMVTLPYGRQQHYLAVF